MVTDIITVIITALASLIVLFLLTKLIGNKQLSQMTLFDYVNGITIGSIAAEFATAERNDFYKPLIAMIIYAVITVLILYISLRSRRARGVLSGKTIILMNKGKIYPNMLRKARIDLDEFLAMLRVNGYFDLSQLETVVFEENGMLSVLPKSANRPLTPSDYSMKVPKESYFYPVVMDGRIMENNLHHLGKDANWLKSQLKQQKSKLTDIFLAVCDESDTLLIFNNE